MGKNITQIDIAATIGLSNKCDSNCSYCYIPLDRRTSTKTETELGAIAIDLVDKFVDATIADNARLDSVTLLAAEPTTIDIDSMVRIVSRLGEITDTVGMITNGIRIGSSDYLEKMVLLKPVNVAFKFAISIDGPAHIHNEHRELHSSTMKALKKMMDNRVDVRINSVVTPYMAKHGAEMLRWLKWVEEDLELEVILKPQEPMVGNKGFNQTPGERMRVAKFVRDIDDNKARDILEKKEREEMFAPEGTDEEYIQEYWNNSAYHVDPLGVATPEIYSKANIPETLSVNHPGYDAYGNKIEPGKTETEIEVEKVAVVEPLDDGFAKCKLVHVSEGGYMSACTNDMLSTNPDKVYAVDKGIKWFTDKVSKENEKIPVECETCKDRTVCELYCHRFLDDNGYAFNCLYGYNDTQKKKNSIRKKL